MLENTALMYCASSGATEVAKLLCEAKANTEVNAVPSNQRHLPHSLCAWCRSVTSTASARSISASAIRRWMAWLRCWRSTEQNIQANSPPLSLLRGHLLRSHRPHTVVTDPLSPWYLTTRDCFAQDKKAEKEACAAAEVGAKLMKSRAKGSSPGRT